LASGRGAWQELLSGRQLESDGEWLAANAVFEELPVAVLLQFGAQAA